jgi:hypothetical protein
MKLYKWCKDCQKVTEHGKGDVFGMKVEFCMEHRFEPWDSLEEQRMYYIHKLIDAAFS